MTPPFQSDQVLEHEHAEKQAAQRATEAKEIDQRIADAVSYAESKSVLRTRSLVAFLASSTLLVTPIPLTPDQIGDHHVPPDENERTVVIDAGRTLTPEFGSGKKEHLLKGFFGIQLESSFVGITCKRSICPLVNPCLPINVVRPARRLTP